MRTNLIWRASLTGRMSCGTALAAALAWGALEPGVRAAEPADTKGANRVETVEYGGWKHNLRLTNGTVELVATLDVGPRVISYRLLPDGKNVFKEYSDQLGHSGETEWMIRGGHRLWAGPEDLTRTYALDNAPVAHQVLGPGHVRLTPRPDAEYGIQKELELKLDPSGSGVTVQHRIKNIGHAPTELAVWGLSVMAPGGMEIIPLPPKRPHPGSPKNAKSPAEFAANQLMRVWPFTDMKDPRWGFGSHYITLTQDAQKGPTKLGLAHQMGWVGYLNGDTLFVKRFTHEADRPYPDGGCNFETFTNEDMLEVESLAPLVRLAPGHAAEHTERWELVGGVGAVSDEASIDREVRARVADAQGK